MRLSLLKKMIGILKSLRQEGKTESRKFMLEQRKKKEEFDEMTKRGTEACKDVPANLLMI
tara:strand:- start:2788 stop:2967 length:180 start_codon:yes stop_codon:yes gene_type:complete